jgi:hypothetical protein
MSLRVIFDRVYWHHLPFDVRFAPKATGSVSDNLPMLSSPGA